MRTGSHESTAEDESLWQWFRGAWLTVALTAASLAVSIGVWLNNALQSWETAAEWGYLSPTEIWSGAVWGLLTPALIHANPVHWLFNAYWLARCGSSVERYLGVGRYAVLVVATAVLGSAAELAISSSTGVGASGVVYGVIGFMWVCRRRFLWPWQVWRGKGRSRYPHRNLSTKIRVFHQARKRALCARGVR